MSMDALTVVVLPVAGALLHHLWSRFRGRMAELRWTVRYTPLAFASDDTGWGRVEILYDGHPTGNLHMANLRLQNASSRDLQALTIVLVVNEGSVAMRAAGKLLNSPVQFPFTDSFSSGLRRLAAGESTPQETQVLLPRTEFLVPVLNRGAVADISVLITRGDNSAPSVVLNCEHVGVRVRHHEFAETIWGVREGQAQFTGVLAAVVLTAIAVLIESPSWAAAVVGCLTGLLAVLLGAALVRLARMFGSLAD
jgi:hypothetical protein